MIIVRIWEGLGNQLFQYAYARSLQQRTQMPVFLDMHHNNKGDLPGEKEDIVKREIGINHFNLSLKGIRIDKIPSLRCIDEADLVDKVRYVLLRGNLSKWRFISDEAVKYNVYPDIFNPIKNTYVNAHCVNKGYYEDFRSILIQELRLRREPELTIELREAIKYRNTVSVHIRLTDYLQNPSAICRQYYYSEAIRFIKTKVSDPYFIIFTDDYEMARKKYKFDEDTYWISKDKYKDYEELMIMSKCRHNIIARSTFSYWGAWLNQNMEKVVVAPRKLFGGSLYEKGWKII